MAGTFELTLLVPKQDFVSLSRPTKANSDGYLELPLPSQPTDAVHDLRAIITEAPEGFWLGSFGLRPIVAEQIGESAPTTTTTEEGVEPEKQWGPWRELQPPTTEVQDGTEDSKMWRLTSEGVLGDYSDLSAVFSGDFERKRRGLKVVPSESGNILSLLMTVC